MVNRIEIGTIDDPSFVWVEDDGETYLELQDSDGNVIIRFNQDESISNVTSLATDKASITHVGARAELTTNQTISTATGTKVNLDNTAFEDTDVFTVDLGNNQIDVDVDGTYHIVATVTWDGSADWSTGDDFRTRVDVNGSIVQQIRQGHPGGNEDQAQVCPVVQELSANDSVAMNVFHQRGGDETVRGNAVDTNLQIIRSG